MNHIQPILIKKLFVFAITALSTIILLFLDGCVPAWRVADAYERGRRQLIDEIVRDDRKSEDETDRAHYQEFKEAVEKWSACHESQPKPEGK